MTAEASAAAAAAHTFPHFFQGVCVCPCPACTDSPAEGVTRCTCAGCIDRLCGARTGVRGSGDYVTKAAFPVVVKVAS